MIVTRTPLRIGFAGGGTDLLDFYKRDYGAVLSTPINKYVYVTIKRHGELFNEKYRLNYSEAEQVESLEDVKNEIARECLRMLRIEPPIYMSTVADLPAFSGLGSSSSFAVGLLNALHALRDEQVSAGQLAEEAARIEIDTLGRPIGKQDHYAAAFGGLNYFRFMPNGTVTVEPQRMENGTVDDLFGHLMLFWTGMSRDSASVLSEQRSNIDDRLHELTTMRGHAMELKALLSNGFDAARFGGLLDDTWRMKRRLAGAITNDKIDEWYDTALEAGALGGKLCGAGGGGFLLFVVEPERRDRVTQALSEMTEIEIGYDVQGSQVVFAE
jgi:D-glycero-alpha-D-manno-heptose-7-phosphate kinase